MFLPSRCERTERILMIARVSLTSNGSRPSRRIVSVMSLLTGPRIFSTASGKVSPCTGVAVEMGDEVAGLEAGIGGRRVVDRRHDLDQAVLHRHLDAEPAELAAGLHLHVVEVLGIQVVRVRVERGQHAVDRALDQRVVGDVVDIVRAHQLEHVAEQVELLVGLGVVRRRGGTDATAA